MALLKKITSQNIDDIVNLIKASEKDTVQVHTNGLDIVMDLDMAVERAIMNLPEVRLEDCNLQDKISKDNPKKQLDIGPPMSYSRFAEKWVKITKRDLDIIQKSIIHYDTNRRQLEAKGEKVTPLEVQIEWIIRRFPRAILRDFEIGDKI